MYSTGRPPGDMLITARRSATLEPVAKDRPDFVELRTALERDDAAHREFRQARARLVDVVDQALARGVRYDELARVTVRAQTGRAPTLEERRREAARLRQLHRRAKAANGRHTDCSGHVPAANDNAVVFSPGKESQPMQRLIKRVIEETFCDVSEKDLPEAELEDADELEDEDQSKEVEAPPPPRRHRR
jgi:hypothetical protein